MSKKGKGKKEGGKAKIEDPFALTPMERELLHLEIEGIGDKIRWRREQLAVVSRNIARWEVAVEDARARRKKTVAELEGALEVEGDPLQAGEVEANREASKAAMLRELAIAIMEFDKEKREHLRTVEEIRNDLDDLERFDVERIGRKMRAASAQLAVGNEGEVLRETDMNRLREDSLREDMANIFTVASQHHQETLRASMDPIHLRIAEETRWFRDSLRLLVATRGRLREECAAGAAGISAAKDGLRRRQEAGREAMTELQEAKGKMREIDRGNAELRKTVEEGLQMQASQNRLRSQLEAAREDMSDVEGRLRSALATLEADEKAVAALEEELAEVRMVGRFLETEREKAEVAIRDELEKSHLYEIPRKNVVQELLWVLEKATDEVYEQLKA